jgi:hypothetical protein
MFQEIKEYFKSRKRKKKLAEMLDKMGRRKVVANDLNFIKLKDKVVGQKSISESNFNRLKKQIDSFEVKCNYCGGKIKDFMDMFTCKYCHMNFCKKHRVPEEHECIGKPMAPRFIKTYYNLDAEKKDDNND